MKPWSWLVVMALVVASAAGAAPPPLLARGERAPDAAVERLEGGRLQLSALKGKVVVLDFWATWCPPCREELPWLLRLARRLEPRGVFFVALNRDDEAQRELASAFAGQLPGLGRHVALATPEVADRFHVDGLPTLYILDREGRVFAAAEGRLTEEAVAAALEQALRR